VNPQAQKRRGAYMLAAEQIAMILAEGAQRIAAAANTNPATNTEQEPTK
jgi:hypothetical protein